MTLPRDLIQFEVRSGQIMRCPPILGQREPEFSGVEAHAGSGADLAMWPELVMSLPLPGSRLLANDERGQSSNFVGASSRLMNQ